MELKYDDKEGQIAELCGRMNASVSLFYAVKGAFDVKTAIKSVKDRIEFYRKETERLNHPILLEGLNELEKILKENKET